MLAISLLGGVSLSGCAAASRRSPGYGRPMTPRQALHWATSTVVLKQVQVLQATYHGHFGRYAHSLEELEIVGYVQEVRETGYPRIVRGGTRPCMAMVPFTRDLPAWSMGMDGVIHRGMYCGRPW